MLLHNDLSAGTDTVTVTTGNSGGLSGDAFDGVTGSLTYSVAELPTLSDMAVLIPSSASPGDVSWNYTPASDTDIYTRMYVYFTGSVPGNQVMAHSGSGGAVSTITFSGGHWRLQCGAGTATGSSTPAAGLWYRVELHTDRKSVV